MRSPVQIWVAAPAQAPGISVIPGDLLCVGESFPLYFPLLAGDPLDEGLHPGGASLLHMIRDVAVDIQCESGGGMAQIALHRFNVIPSPDSGNGVGMAKVVEPQGGETNLCGQTFEITVDIPVRQTAAQFVCKHQPVFLPTGAGMEPPLGLFLPLAAQGIHHESLQIKSQAKI